LDYRKSAGEVLPSCIAGQFDAAPPGRRQRAERRWSARRQTVREAELRSSLARKAL
jgi:hypothetical protein